MSVQVLTRQRQSRENGRRDEVCGVRIQVRNGTWFVVSSGSMFVRTRMECEVREGGLERGSTR